MKSNKYHCYTCEDGYAEEEAILYKSQEDTVDNEDMEDWKRILGYFCAVIVFFYILFKYLI